MTRHEFEKVSGGVTAPQGFLAAGLHAGIKKPSVLDLALIVSTAPAAVAGVFTRNRVAAAPVLLDRAQIKAGRGRAFFINSGNANACTGAQGMADAKEMARLAGHHLGIPPQTVFVGSTGVIGQFLPMPKIRKALPRLVQRLSRSGGGEAARAILTTDLKAKQTALRTRIGRKTVTVGGMAKGSGMIHPDMATMLAYLTTDAAVAPAALQRVLRDVVARTFNCISVDGDTSTNDTVLCLANGLAGNPVLRFGSSELLKFQSALEEVSRYLALQICRDGEGVTKVLRIHVVGGRTGGEARQVARTIGTSSLVKTALFGEDANWGRIMAAAGRSGVPLDQDKLGLSIEGVPVVKKGMSLGAAAERAIEKLVRRKEFTIQVSLGRGSSEAVLWTTDLSYEYVRINASYRS